MISHDFEAICAEVGDAVERFASRRKFEGIPSPFQPSRKINKKSIQKKQKKVKDGV
jgi:hypothetical protein